MNSEKAVGIADTPTDSSKRFWQGHPKIAWTATLFVAAAVATLVQTTFDVLTVLTPDFFPKRSSSEPPANVASTTQQSNPYPPPQPSSPVLPPDVTSIVGGCATEVGQWVACREPHLYEAVAGPGEPCTQEALVKFLGGVSAVEVLLVEARPLPYNEAFCGVKVLTSGDRVQSIRGQLLKTPNMHAWRRCTRLITSDDRLPCSEPHQGEYIGLAAGGSDCVEAFESYVGTRFDQVSDQLVLSRVQPSGTKTQSCLASALGNSTLIGSIRNLGVGALPRP